MRPGNMTETGADSEAPSRPRGERAARIAFWLAAYLFLFYLFLKSWEIAGDHASIDARRIDFIAFWAAAKLALAGEAHAAFDPVTLSVAAGLGGDVPGNLLWLYPPGFLALVTPLGALPLWAAWCVFTLASAACLALAVRVPAKPLPGGWRLVVASPAVLIGALAIGQNSVLWTASLIAALSALRQGRPALAGLFIALLTLKPQLGLLIPVALLASREWRALGWAAVFAALICAAATLPFGLAYWQSFGVALADAMARLDGGSMPVSRLVTVYGFVRALGLEHATAIWSQWAASLALATAVGWAWSRPAIGPDLRAALLCAAIPLATPYAFYYEMPLTLAAAVFLVRDGFGKSPSECLWMGILWLGPITPLYAPMLHVPALTDNVSLIATPMIVVTTALCLVRAWRRAATPSPVCG